MLGLDLRDIARALSQDNAGKIDDAALVELANDAIMEVFPHETPHITTIKSTDSGFTMAAAAYSDSSTASALANVRTVKSVHVLSSQANEVNKDGPELELVPFTEIVYLILNQTTQGTPTKYHLHRRMPYGNATNSGGSTPGLAWTLYVHPICDGTYYFPIRAQRYPTLLTSINDSMPFSDLANNLVSRIVAARMARLLGQPEEFIANLWSAVDGGYERLRRTAQRKLVTV